MNIIMLRHIPACKNMYSMANTQFTLVQYSGMVRFGTVRYRKNGECKWVSYRTVPFQNISVHFSERAIPYRTVILYPMRSTAHARSSTLVGGLYAGSALARKRANGELDG